MKLINKIYPKINFKKTEFEIDLGFNSNAKIFWYQNKSFKPLRI